MEGNKRMNGSKRALWRMVGEAETEQTGRDSARPWLKTSVSNNQEARFE